MCSLANSEDPDEMPHKSISTFRVNPDNCYVSAKKVFYALKYSKIVFYTLH